MSDASASIELDFERNPDSKAIQNSKSIRKEFTTKPKLQRTADKVLRLLSVHISFAVDVR